MKGSGSIYVVAWVTNGIGPEMDYFYTPEDAVRCMESLIDDGAKPIEEDDPEEFLSAYYEWVTVDNDNNCNTDISLIRIKV